MASLWQHIMQAGPHANQTEVPLSAASKLPSSCVASLSSLTPTSQRSRLRRTSEQLLAASPQYLMDCSPQEAEIKQKSAASLKLAKKQERDLKKEINVAASSFRTSFEKLLKLDEVTAKAEVIECVIKCISGERAKLDVSMDTTQERYY